MLELKVFDVLCILFQHMQKDNNFASKLMSSLDITVNHELLSSRGGPVDYSQCSDLLIRLLNQSQENLKTQGTLDGTWDYNSYDSDGNFSDDESSYQDQDISDRLDHSGLEKKSRVRSLISEEQLSVLKSEGGS